MCIQNNIRQFWEHLYVNVVLSIDYAQIVAWLGNICISLSLTTIFV